MEKIIEKISSYDIINNFIPGVIFVVFVKELFNIALSSYGIIADFIIYYIVGSVLSRIGSILVEPLLLKIKFVKFEPYHKFIEASKKDDKINILMETTNLYRTMIATFLLLIFLNILEVFKENLPSFFIKNKIFIILLMLLLLYLYSFKKQVDYVKKRINKYTGGSNNEQ